MKVYGIYVI